MRRAAAGALLAPLAALACSPVADLNGERERLLEADRAFARETQARGVEGWVSYFAADGVMFRSGGPVVGHEGIRELMAPAFGDTTFSLTWEPQAAEVAEAGDLGYTYGRYRSTRIVPNRQSEVRTGSYVTIWRRQLDATWRVALDIGSPDAPPN